jgi:hypothetical protein
MQVGTRLVRRLASETAVAVEILVLDPRPRHRVVRVIVMELQCQAQSPDRIRLEKQSAISGDTTAEIVSGHYRFEGDPRKPFRSECMVGDERFGRRGFTRTRIQADLAHGTTSKLL